MVLGKPGELWNSTRHQGHLYLPTLGVMVPMTVGDMVFFHASELPHLVIKLDEADKHKRTIVTTFTCAQIADALEHPPAFCLPHHPPASPAIFAAHLCPALHIHTDNKPALIPTHGTGRRSVSPAHPSHSSIKFRGIIKHTAEAIPLGATGLANAEYDLTVVSLASKDARATNLPNQDTDPSRLANKYLDSVADHKVQHRPRSNLPFHPIVFSLGGMMNGSTTKVFASWKRVMTRGTYNLMLKRLSLSLLQARVRSFEL
ncbi:hypothetical protein EHS25_000930 [Saitozyma podzolica]|uniref:Uncharacterized protein n=1 Tax=Saitozyma podzolica TaxID=1890683 RepID=A0A427YXM6_9TREE|nr:hypothetical protein EHS25_000930 [Saitozyma podzolica]